MKLTLLRSAYTVHFQMATFLTFGLLLDISHKIQEINYMVNLFSRYTTGTSGTADTSGTAGTSGTDCWYY